MATSTIYKMSEMNVCVNYRFYFDRIDASEGMMLIKQVH